MGERRASKGLIASRLDHLFRTVHPKDRGPYTAAEIAAAINDAAGEHVIGATYIWQLRTGRRDNPTYKHLLALSRFFGVSPMYFFDEAEAERGAIPAEVTAALKDDEVREITLRAVGLSEHSLKAIRAMIDSARAMERIPSEDSARSVAPK
jgi:transcriptional regulator with XRE-family HTH domain